MKAKLKIESNDIEIREVEMSLQNSLKGTPGLPGADGKSAYQSYVETTEDDPILTEAEWSKSNKDSVKFSKQTLTAAQAAQARENLQITAGQTTTLPNIDVKINRNGDILVKPDYIFKNMMIGFTTYRNRRLTRKFTESPCPRRKNIALIDVSSGFYSYDMVGKNNLQIPPVLFIATEEDGSMKLPYSVDKLFKRFFKKVDDTYRLIGLHTSEMGFDKKTFKIGICTCIKSDNKFTKWNKGISLPIKLCIYDNGEKYIQMGYSTFNYMMMG